MAVESLKVGSDLAGFTVALKGDESLRHRLRAEVGRRGGAFAREVRAAMADLERIARDLGYAGLLVVLDSLEKLRGMSSNWQEVLDSAERVVVRLRGDLAVGVHVLYTVPMAMLWRMTGIIAIPMIKLYRKVEPPDGPLLPAGREAAERLVEARVDPDGLRELFGDDRKAVVERLIRLSGGYPRDLVRLLRACLQEFRDGPLSPRAVGRVTAVLEGDLQRLILQDDIELLRSIAAQRRVLPTAESLQGLDRLVRAQVVLAYHNDQPWFDIHPAARGRLIS